MRTKTTYVIIALFLVTNFVWGYVFYIGAMNNADSGQVEIYTLEGSSTHWQVSDYQIIVTPEKVERGHAEFVYLGDAQDIVDSDYYSISFYEGTPTGEHEVVYRNSALAIGGNVNIIENVKSVGSILGPNSQAETIKTKNDYANSFAEITWNDSAGNEQTEIINLVISSHFNLEKFMQ